MAVANESTYDTLKRAPSYSGSYTVSLAGDSTLSIEDLGSVDIDAIVNKRWVLDEVIGQLQSRLAILSGGRDRRGGPIITLYATETADLRPSNLGKILSYLSKVPDEAVQGLGFTIILDAQHVSWTVTKHAIKSLQLTFVEHIHQLLIVKPRSFWQRQKTGMSVTLKKGKYGFPVVMLENSGELFQHLQVSQVTSDLGGTIRFNHQEWIDTQRVLEKHLIQLLNRLDGYEHVREQLEQQERPSSLNESRDSVRRHVDAQDIISKEDLDCECEAVSHAIAKLRPCTNPDFNACFGRLEEMCSCLLSMQVQLQRMWDEKGAKLDQVVQLRKYEHDSSQMMQWIEVTTQSLSSDHTDIGDTLSSAEINKQTFNNFQSRISSQYQEISRVITVGERLVASRHYALDVMQVGNKKLRVSWERFSRIVEDRNNMFELSVVFHDWQQKFFLHIDVWSDACSSGLVPSSTSLCREALSQHKALRERYQLMYNTTRSEGHRLLEKLKKPVGDSSVPAKFVMGSRHVKETLENLFDEFNWLEEQWSRRNATLQRALTYNLFLDETKKVYSWLGERGWVFLVSNAYLGGNTSGAQALIQQHDTFETEAKEIYSTSLQLFERARLLAANGECEREILEGESRKLEVAVHTFAAVLDERRDLLVQACTFYCSHQMLVAELEKLVQPVPREQFTGLPSSLEKRQVEFGERKGKVDDLASQCYDHTSSLLRQLEGVMRSSRDAGHLVSYTNTVRSIQHVLVELKEEKRRVDEVCQRRHRRWGLSLQLDRLHKDTEKFVTAVEVWCTEEEGSEWVPSATTVDSQLQLDSVQGQYNQLVETSDSLLAGGKTIAMETEQLDSVMFGSPQGPAHPVATTISGLESKISAARKVLDGIAIPRLSKCRECLTFHLLRHRCQSLTSALSTLTSSTAQLPPIGHSLQSANSTIQRYTENNQKLEALCKDVDVFGERVEGCKEHYEARQLGLLAHCLRERKELASRAIGERVRVARSGVSFYKGVDRLGSIMDKCRSHFNSSDVVFSVSDAERLLSTLHELRDLVEQATASVRTQGKQLVEFLAMATPITSSPTPTRRAEYGSHSPVPDTRSLNSSDSGDTSDLDNGVKRPTPKRIRSSDDLLDDRPTVTMGESTTGSEEGDDVMSEEAAVRKGDSPRLLVTPRKTRPGLKSYKGSTVSLALSPDQRPVLSQIMIESQLYKVDQQLQGLQALWEHRRAQLETSRRVIEFKEAVPDVTTWLETRGTELLKNKNNFGRSREEVLQLLTEHDGSDDREVADMKTKVESLLESYRLIEANGHRELNHIRGIASSLEWEWTRFHSDMELRHKNLHLSLSFQDYLYEGSNWVQKTRALLDSLTQRTESVDRSEEAAKVRDELSLYISCTVKEQEDRVTETKRISAELHSNVLVEQAAQIEHSTQDMMRDLESFRLELERLHEKLVQIESEKDRERRLTKQRERVLEEMLQTEETYVADLKLIEKCRPRFVSEVLPSTLKGKEDIIFSNIQDVDAFHRLYLLPQLKERATTTDEAARIFIECAHEMTGVYVPYCKSKMASEDLLTSHRTYLSRMQSMFGLEMPLSSLLIKPVQRITKYPLLLKDAIKYTSLLGQPTEVLEEGLRAVEKVLAETNNAIHLSHLQNFEEQDTVRKLYFQGSLQVSETKFTIKAEKDRHVFVFDAVIVFARKVCLQQAEFKYEFKCKIALSAVQQLVEFVDGEPTKFTLVTTDHRLHLKAPSLDVKQVAVKAIRTALLCSTSPRGEYLTQQSSPAMSAKRKFPVSMRVDRVSSDLMNPSPRPSPPLSRRANGTVPSNMGAPVVNGFDKFQVSRDYSTSGDHPLTLKKGDVVEVLDNKIEERWFVRTQTASPEAGWIPPTVLMPIGRDETDGRSSKTTITSGVLGGDKLQKYRSQPSFGSHDLQSHQVISTLKKITLQEEEDEGDEGDTSSLDVLPSPRVPHVPPQSRNGEEEQAPPPSVSVDPSMLSPHHATANGLSSEEDPTRLSSSVRSTSWNHRPTRRALYRKKKGSISSERSESPTEKITSGSSEESIQAPEATEKEATPEPPDPETAKNAREKLKHIVAEMVQTEQDYVTALDMCINGYMKAMQSEDLPSVLANKERLIFGNIQAVHDFHSNHFLVSLQLAGDDVAAVGKCFLDHSSSFEVYITYCENKPKSESFIWTYLHTGGTFFQDIQKRLKQRQGIDSFLIKPVQRISQYQLLLRDLQKSAVKSGLLSTPQLDAALQQMQDVPKRANDAMTLSMICGYDGAISASGQLIMHDEFTVYERSRWTGASRQLFLMDQRLIFTKEKDADGLYVYKDSLKVHSLSIVEKQDDSPLKFAVGTGPINSWDQYYVLEASSPEKKQVWVEAIKKILQQQFELLKALKQPAPSARHRSQTLGPATFMNSVAHINVSDDSEDEGAEEGDQLTPFSPLWSTGHPGQRRQTTAGLPVLTVGENTANSPTFKPRPLNLYVVAEDCAPSKDNEGILFIRKGQVYHIMNKSSDWWCARLARDVTADGAVGKQGWVPSSFLEKFTKSLSADEEAAYWMSCHHSETNASNSTSSKKATILPTNSLPSSGATSYSRKQRLKSPKSCRKRQKITSSFMEDVSYGEDGPEQQQRQPPAVADNKSPTGKAPQVVTHLTDETVIVSRTVRFRCKISGSHPEPSVEWSHDGKPLTHDRAFTSLGDENCLLRLQNVAQEDEGMYTCTICNKHGCCTSAARLTVIGPPSIPGKPVVKPVTSTSVRISWTLPTYTGHSPINLYLIECKDTLSGRWSTLMQRVTDTSTVMDDLMPGTEYVFRVIAGNQIGSSPPSPESDPVITERPLVLGTEFSLEPFHDHYQLVNIIARGQFSEIWECLHCSTQQSYVAKLIPLSSGDHAHHELRMLTRFSHTNMVCVSATYQTDKSYIFLFQLLKGLNLFEHVTVTEQLTEPLAAYYMEQLVSALEYLHNLNIVHLAIKPENVMVVKPARELPVVKLLHFSRAHEVRGGAPVVVQPHLDHMEFEAPELLKGEPVSVATDMWSLGVLLYTLLGGVSPFLVDSLDLTKDNITSGRYSFPSKHFKTMSESARSVISSLLVGDQSGRLTASQCLQHSWTRQLRPPNDTSSSAVSLDLSHLKSYVSTRKWQTSAFTISSAEH